jgi:hypothetical protein
MGDPVRYTGIGAEQAFRIAVGYGLDVEPFREFRRGFVPFSQSSVTSILKEADDLPGEEVGVKTDHSHGHHWFLSSQSHKMWYSVPDIICISIRESIPYPL